MNKLKLSLCYALLAMSLPSMAALKNVTAISVPTSSGQKLVAAALEYDEVISNKDLKISSFAIEGRTITGVYATNALDLQAPAGDGNIVILQLDGNDELAALTTHEPREPSVERQLVLNVQQKQALVDAQGQEVAPGQATSSKTINLVVDDFKQYVYTDPETGIQVPYNLYVPKDYDPTKSYPLVMFIHDAGATNSNIRNTLLHGNGATVWASPEFQARHQAFVLAPQYDHVIVNDNSDDPVDLDPTINLIKSLQQQYNIDAKRLYTTGQSGGGMMSIAMNSKYPDFFAASYLVACQWDPAKTVPMANNKLFIFVSQDDKKAYPGQNAILAELAKHGAKIGQATWQGNASVAELNQATQELLAQGGNIHYAVIASGTLPVQIADPNSTHPAQAHLGTWEISYNIPAIQDWLFAQKKD
ncbi:hypothetical protein CJP74_06205 [Psittacicella melopsittaci]|uniref:Uncharacterized protein n=1 Tax=Psittacicella melopsittaci TaxID=2028576 RepID=A0A3A1Y3N1_9GAMM|nr:PHB depolymerase family esterase [Psittacicella melopsittaci]RIY31828.1 hypothetical protein CJP74_06205 [Psittacicella melopsittaci]